MTEAFSGQDLAQKINQILPDSVVESAPQAIVVKKESLFDVMRFLQETPELDFNYLTNITGIDYPEYLELIYQLVSLRHNHSLVVKTRCYEKEKPVVPSVVSLWQGANLQEREIYDLLGIEFEGHPDLRRLLLWEGFPGHPLRKDWKAPGEEETTAFPREETQPCL